VDNKIGIVQGRLTQSPNGQLQWFPDDHWQEEFAIASENGFDFIELFAERTQNDRNPLWSDEGITTIKELTSKNNLQMEAVNNNYIITHSLLNDKKALVQNKRLLDQCQRLGIKNLILPCLEESNITVANMSQFKDILIELADVAQMKQITILLETYLGGDGHLKLFDMLNHSNIKCVYDTGNGISQGYDLYNDIKKLADYIGLVHIKDKSSAGENVVLCTGEVDFYSVFKALEQMTPWICQL